MAVFTLNIGWPTARQFVLAVWLCGNRLPATIDNLIRRLNLEKSSPQAQPTETPMRRYQRELSVALAYLLLLGALAVFAPSFYRGDKLWSILVNSAPVLVAGLGMTLIILLRQI